MMWRGVDERRRRRNKKKKVWNGNGPPTTGGHKPFRKGVSVLAAMVGSVPTAAVFAVLIESRWWFVGSFMCGSCLAV